MVNKLFTNTKDFFGKQQTSILAAGGIIMTTVFASRILGLVRDRLLTARFTPDELGLYFAAFRLPNMVFELIVVGALSSAFIPVFTYFLSKNQKTHAFHLASSVINIGLVIFALFALIIFLFTPSISSFIAPGYSDSERQTVVFFTRIMLIAQVLPLIVGNFLTGVLQSYKKFIIPALAPVIYNIGAIIGIVLFTPHLHLFAPVVGVVLGAFLFCIIQMPAVLSLGYQHLPVFDYRDKGVKEVGRLMLPRTIGLAVSQIDSTVDLILASLLGARSVAIFNLAQHLQYVPVGLFGASIAQAALPTLSELQARKNMKEFKKAFLTTFHQILFLTLPAAVLLIVLRIPLVRLVFGASQFDWPATVMTGKTLAFFSLSLFAQAQVHLLTRAFYSLYDSKTPVVIGSIAVAINTLLSIFFIRFLKLPVWGLGLSASIGSTVHAFLLLLLLDRTVSAFDRKSLIIPSIKMITASFITAFSLYVPMKLMDQLVFDTTRTFNLFLLTGTASIIGLSVYAFLAWFLNIEEVKLFYHLAKKVMKVKPAIIETPSEVIDGETTKV